MNQRILFMGTPEFAVASLNALMEARLEVAAVVTAPDRPAGRGQQLRMSAVKERALELGLPVLQPEKLRAPEFLAQVDALNASLYVVVAFRMLPELVWNRPAMGAVNLHASLLPDYRGAAPINWAVINGEQRTGLTTFRIGADIDTGDILLRETVDISEDEDAGGLHDRMKVVGADLLARTVKDLFDGTLASIPQRDFIGGDAHAAPKLTRLNTRIDWRLPAVRVHNLVRGLAPLPGAWTLWKEHGQPDRQFKVLRSSLIAAAEVKKPHGTVLLRDGKLLVCCGDGWLEAVVVQAEGKRPMPARDFLRGLRTRDGIRLA